VAAPTNPIRDSEGLIALVVLKKRVVPGAHISQCPATIQRSRTRAPLVRFICHCTITSVAVSIVLRPSLKLAIVLLVLLVVKSHSTLHTHTTLVFLRPVMKNIATNCMPEVVSDLPYNFKKVVESCPQVDS